MAKKITEILVDDIDGTEIKNGGGETVYFALDGKKYEIDLSNANAHRLREALSQFIHYGRRSRGVRATVPARRRHEGLDLNEVRAWARARGERVSDRGRVPERIIEDYKNRIQ